jgi:tetratricopeptide (TPR) repeat protein
MTEWDDAERRVEKAQELFEQRRWSEALEELRAATDINPYNGGWFFNIGLTLDEMGRHEEAIDAYRRALAIDEADLQAMNHLGVDLHRVGNFEEALRTFEKIEQLDPSFESAYCNRIITYSEIGDHERAEEMFYLARLYKEHCPHCYYNIGCSLADRGQFDKAIYCWQKTLDLDENHPDVQVRIAEALWGKGELEAARQHYLIGLRQDPAVLMDLSNLLLDTHQPRAAVACLKRLVQVEPNNSSAWQNLAVAQFLTGRYEDGIESCQECLRLEPASPEPLYNLALACEHLGRFDEALSWVRRGLDRDPRDVWLQQLELRIRVLRWRGRLVRAVRALLFRKN